MEALKNKQFQASDYLCRYNGVPYYYNYIDERQIGGIGSNMKKTSTYVSHKVLPTDNLDSLALKYYNNPTYWWVIAFFNDIQDPFIQLDSKYKLLKIPNISSIGFGDER